MPQLDQYSFLSQLFWLLVVFGFFYIVTLTYVLPTISQILKTRKNQIKDFNSKTHTLKIESSLFNVEYSRMLVTFFMCSHDILDKCYKSSSSWSESQIQLLNEDLFGKANKSYVKSLATLVYSNKYNTNKKDFL